MMGLVALAAPRMPSGLATAQPVQNRQGPCHNSSTRFRPRPSRAHSSNSPACRCQGSGTCSKWSGQVYPTRLTWRTSSWRTSPARPSGTTTRYSQHTQPAAPAAAQLSAPGPHQMLPAWCACRRATTATSWGRTSAQDVSSTAGWHAAVGRALPAAASRAPSAAAGI